MGIDTEKTNRHIFLRVLLGLALVISCASVFQVATAEAACGWSIYADTEETYGSHATCGNGESRDGTFRSELITDGDQVYLKITLNNYHSGSILYESYASGPSVEIKKVVVELVGDNVINAPHGRGIGIGSPIEFIGQGKLEITAMFPFGGGYLCYWQSPPTKEQASVCSFAPIQEAEAAQIRDILVAQTVFITPRTAVEEAETSPQDPTQDENDTPTEDGETSSGSDEDEKKCPDPALAERTPASGWTVWGIVAVVYVGVSLAAFIGLAVRWFVKRKKAPVSKNTVQQDHENNDDSQGDTQGVL